MFLRSTDLLFTYFVTLQRCHKRQYTSKNTELINDTALLLLPQTVSGGAIGSPRHGSAPGPYCSMEHLSSTNLGSLAAIPQESNSQPVWWHDSNWHTSSLSKTLSNMFAWLWFRLYMLMMPDRFHSCWCYCLFRLISSLVGLFLEQIGEIF